VRIGRNGGEGAVNADIADPTRTRDILRRHGLDLRKKWGQHFLVSPAVLRNIAEASGAGPEDGVLEIGPGIGALTEQLARRAGLVVAVEIDERLLPVLAETLAPYPNVRLLHADALRLDWRDVWSRHFGGMRSVRVAANLPYNVATAILTSLLSSGVRFERMVVMVQKEVADRLAASPGTKAYGSLTVAVRYRCDVERIAVVSARCFVPPPKVDSAVVRLTPKMAPAPRARDETLFFGVVRACFAQRRKTIANNLLAACFGSGDRAGDRVKVEELLRSVGIDPSRRAETMSVEEFVRLADRLAEEERFTHPRHTMNEGEWGE